MYILAWKSVTGKHVFVKVVHVTLRLAGKRFQSLADHIPTGSVFELQALPRTFIIMVDDVKHDTYGNMANICHY